MSEEIYDSEQGKRSSLPIEKGFPIERVNQIAEKEGRGVAKRYYRPIYTMHKWWARRLGCVFRTISLYTLADDPDLVDVSELGADTTLSSFDSNSNIADLIETVDITDPDSLWELYSKDVNIADKRVLDPFMGGGTSVIEASRFGVNVDGIDLNPVAWFVTKKEVETGATDPEELKEAYEALQQDVAEEIKQYYKTGCPDDDSHEADVMYNFWVKQLDCTSCDTTVDLFADYRISKGRYDDSDKYNVLCPECNSVFLTPDWKKESSCSSCGHTFIPQEGNTDYGDYICHSCGQQYPITDAIEEQDGYDWRLYAVEYHCTDCSSEGKGRARTKGYKSAEQRDIRLFQKAREEWEESVELKNYVPQQEIRPGWKTDANQFEGSMPGNGNLPRHGIKEWKDMFNERQLLCLSKLLRSIDKIENQTLKEYLLLSFSDSLRGNTMMVNYQVSSNAINHVFTSNSFDPPKRAAENNVWGADEGARTFVRAYQRLIDGVEYGNAPFDRYVDDNGESVKSKSFRTKVGENTNVRQGNVMELEADSEYDAVITDPPYYNNVLYSELSDYFYVWLKILLEDEYDCFSSSHTPRSESIVANPAEQKGVEEFESELKSAFSNIHKALTDDGAFVFTYHHSDSESWGELLEVLCDVGFEVTASYPITADLDQLVEGESVSFDIIIVARPAGERQPISWNSLRRDIYRTAQRTRRRLEENRNLSRGDIGVVEMGRCFHEYSKHHGKVERAGEVMTAKEVVNEIYGVIQHGSDIGEVDVFLDLLETPGGSYDDLNKLCHGTNATPERMKDMRLYRMDDGFKLGTWNDEKRLNYIQRRVDKGEELTDLDKAQFLRYRWEHGKSVTEYLEQWEITDDLRELCEGLADATGDDTYRNILESRLSDF